MTYRFKFSEQILLLMRCPICKERLIWYDTYLQCCNCQTCFPIINDIPILINDDNSVFATKDYTNQHSTTFDLSYYADSPPKKLLRAIKEYQPKLSKSFGISQNMGKFKELLKTVSDKPRLLIVGGSIEGNEVNQLIHDVDIELVETDVSFGPRTSIICDAHDIPFADDSFDGILAQATLEHVAAPWRCVAEFHRVTKPNGIVFATTPFIAQVHMGRYDFTRFTYLGHRRLFRRYEEIDSGMVNGPGTALGWSYFYFLMSFSESKLSKALIRRFGRFTGFWFKYLDYYLLTKPGAYDAAAGYYFMGRKKEGYLLSDRELITLYKGIQ